MSAAEGTRLTSADVSMSVGDTVQILGGNQVSMTTSSLDLNAATAAGVWTTDMSVNVAKALTASVGAEMQVTSAGIQVDVGEDVRESGLAEAFVGWDQMHVSTGADLSADIGTSLTVLSENVGLDVVSGVAVSATDVSLESVGHMKMAGQSGLEVTAAAVALEWAMARCGWEVAQAWTWVPACMHLSLLR